MQISKELRLWDCLVPGTCGYPDDRHLYNLSFDSVELIQACSTITLGPGLSVVAPGEVTILSGESVALAGGVYFEGGEVTLGTDPALLP